MEDNYHRHEVKNVDYPAPTVAVKVEADEREPVKSGDCGMFDFTEKKEEAKGWDAEDATSSEFHHKVRIGDDYPDPNAAVKVEADEREPVRSGDRGMYDFIGKKEESKGWDAEDVTSSEFDHKVRIGDDYPVPAAGVIVEAYEREPVKSDDRGIFDFIGKKEEAKDCDAEGAISSEFDHKTRTSDEKKEDEPCKEEEKHESLIDKLKRSGSSTSSSSDEEEVEEGGEKRKKKKGLKEKIKEKLSGDKKEEKEEEHKCEETSIPVEKYEDAPVEKYEDAPSYEPEEKKGFLDKIKEKLPGGKKPEEVHNNPPPPEYCDGVPAEADGKEKKGFLDKIKEKIPGFHHKSEEDKEKEKEKEKEKVKEDACD